jgi:hypothetical protein
MKKAVALFLLITFLIFVGTNIVYSYSSSTFGRLFGGKIISMKATQIEELEASGYICSMFGTSISIKPIGSRAGTPTSYFIPSYVSPKTRTTPGSGKLIIGKYSGQEIITCTLPGEPPLTETIVLNTITFFGTSR